MDSIKYSGFIYNKFNMLAEIEVMKMKIRYIVDTGYAVIDTDSIKKFVHYIYKFGYKNIKRISIKLGEAE